MGRAGATTIFILRGMCELLSGPWNKKVVAPARLHELLKSLLIMKLSIYSLKKILFAGEATLLNCKTAVGEITVLDNHETYIGKLATGVIKVVEKPFGTAQGKEHFFEISSGFLEVRQGNEVRCIVD